MLYYTFVLLVILLLSFQGLALPSIAPRIGCNSPRTTEVTANFDNITAIPGTTGIIQVPDPYDGLFYQSFVVVSTVPTGITPLVLPHSPKQCAGTSSNTQATTGTPMLTVNYPGNSATSAFELESFYFGCALDLHNGAADAPEACLVEITAYFGYDNQVSNAQQACSQQFQYNPSTQTGPQQMAFSGSLKSCFAHGVQFAIIQFGAPGGLSATNPALALVIDDVKYKLYTC